MRQRIGIAAGVLAIAWVTNVANAQKIYWGENGTDKIQRADADGLNSNVQDLVTTDVVTPQGIALDLAAGKMYWVDANIGGPAIRRSDLTGANVEPPLVVTGPSPTEIALDLAGGKMYWIDATTIRRANLNGSGAELLVSGLFAGRGIDLDLAAGKIYWAQRGDGFVVPKAIKRANFNGSGAESLITDSATLGILNALKVHPGLGKMYWADENGRIRRANLDGSSPEDVITSLFVQQPIGLALDPIAGKVYWSDANSDRIRRASLSGVDSQVENVVTTGLIEPRGIAIDPGCGNGVVTLGEEPCDDGNAIEGDGCDSNCTLTGCGNGIQTPGEGCDDGNAVEGDGCDTNCTVSACGNGILASGEECDDGNFLNNDGCDFACQIEPFLFVDENATGPIHDGSSWCEAFLELHQALAVVGSNEAILVANGTYAPNPSGLRDATFTLMDNLRIEGGYAGCGDPNPADRDVLAHETILTGDLNGDDPGSSVENSYHVVTGGATNASAVLDGFTITGGHADGTSPANVGGGVYLAGGSPTLQSCLIKQNTATGGGGGVYKESGTSPDLVDCTFLNNTTTGNGGGMLSLLGTPRLVNCRFLGNLAGNGGGFSNATVGASPTLVNCIFSGNAATNNGGGVQNSAASPAFVNCTFSGNTAVNGGGGLNNLLTGAPTLSNSILWGNSDSGGMDESAQINLVAGSVMVNYCDIQGLTGVFGGSGNIDDDPMFVDADGADNMAGTLDDDLRLQSGSMCIDSADNTRIPADATDLDNDGDSTERTPLDLDRNGRFADWLATMGTGMADPPNYPRIADIGAYELQECLNMPQCADLNSNLKRDDNCVWELCDGGNCVSTNIIFGDIGGAGGPDRCDPDGSADNNDAFHALNCFSNGNFGQAGNYPCDDANLPMQGDIGGSGLSCCPDGACDNNDRFLALQAFSAGGGPAGPNGCVCPSNPISPGQSCPPNNATAPYLPRFTDQAILVAVASSRTAKAGDMVSVDVFMANAVKGLQGYQLHLGVSGGRRGSLELVDIAIADRQDFVYGDLPFVDAYNLHTQQMLADRDEGAVATKPNAYLATFTYRVSGDAAGTFVIDVLGHSTAKSENRTFLFGPINQGMVELVGTKPAVVVVTSVRAWGVR